MILYREDWLTHPFAIVDYQTKNRSFVEFASILHKMGIKNCLFPLALHDKTLQGVDPFSPDLTEEQKQRIYVECYENPWYFIREVCQLPGAGADGFPIQANRAIIALWWCVLQNFNTFLMQPRQTGKSVGADTINAWKLYFRCYNIDSVVLTRNRDLIAKNVARLKKIRDNLPKHLLLTDRKDKDIDSMLNYTKLKNVITFACAQGDQPSAVNAARGFTVANIQVDEGPFIKYVESMIPAMSSAMDSALNTAKQEGMPYGIIYTTTAGDLSLPHGSYMYNIFRSGCTWTESFYDVENTQKLTEIIFQNTGNPNPMMSMIFDHRMLGISDEEFWRRINAVPSTEEDINKDYFLIWGKGGTDSIVSTKILEAMGKAARRPDYNELTEMGYVVRWYVPKEKIDEYMRENKCVLGVDTSDQIKGDSTAFVLMNVETLEIVATANINDANIVTTANWLSDFMVKYENVTLIIEKKSSAQTFIDTTLLMMHNAKINPFKRIWNSIIDDRTTNEKMYYLVKAHRGGMIPREWVEDCRKYFGFNQTAATRKLLYGNVLEDAASQSRNVMYDDGIVNQISQLKITREGRVDHGSGGHDDGVIAWLLAQWMLRYGKNLDYYGIDSRRVANGVNKDGKRLTEEDQREIQLISKINDEIDGILEDISRTTHPGMLQRLTHRLAVLNKQLSEYGVEPRTLDAVQKNHQYEKRQNKIRKYMK